LWASGPLTYNSLTNLKVSGLQFSVINNSSMAKNTNFQIYNVGDIVKIEEKDRKKMSLGDKVADRVTAVSGTMSFVILHVLIFGGWILINTGILPLLEPFDPFPFSLLTTAVSLEAIFLSIFVLITQNKQSLIADKRAKIDLQINLIAERENTKLINMVLDMQEFLGMRKKSDPEMKELRKKTDIKTLAKELEKAEVEIKRKK
jgi:uncharacterized membrane protein